MRNGESVIKKFEELPRRIFLDSTILQTLQVYGEYIWDNVDLSRTDKNFLNIEALRNIFLINQRANFEFSLSENSIKEVLDKTDHYYIHWALDVLDHWMCCIKEYENSEAFSGSGENFLQKINETQFGYLSKKDKLLVFDAVKLECDAFLTMDIKLWKNAEHLQKALKIQILQPYEYWNLIKPFAALYF